MKKLNIGISATLLFAATAFVSCKKVEKDPPVPDTEVNTAIDACYATQIVSDVEMICSVMGEDASTARAVFYEPNVGTSGTVTVIRNTQTRRLSYTFNQTQCRDGRLRDGSIWMYYKWRLQSQLGGDSIKPGATLPYDEFDYVYPDLPQGPYSYTGNENYTRDYNFGGRITLEEYKVDGWLVDNKDFENPNPNTNNVYAYIKNLRPNNLTPVAGNLRWSFEGQFKMKKNLDSMAWKGKWTRTLDNTSDPKVFATSAQSPITWSLATISFYGEAYGFTPGNVPYKIQYQEKNPMKRNFTCSPDVVGNIIVTTTSSLVPYRSEYHPIVAGVATFTTGTAYPREIYYDNTGVSYGDDTAPVNLPAQCDNKATVQIKGIFYPIDLKY